MTVISISTHALCGQHAPDEVSREKTHPQYLRLLESFSDAACRSGLSPRSFNAYVVKGPALVCLDLDKNGSAAFTAVAAVIGAKPAHGMLLPSTHDTQSYAQLCAKLNSFSLK